MAKLYIDSIIKEFNGKSLLRDISISCVTGQIIGILGRNGTGKSTLFKIVMGVISSTYSFTKCDETVLTTVWQRKDKIAFLPQKHFFPGNLRIKTLCELLSTKEDQLYFSNLPLIKERFQMKVSKLSGGERRFIEVVWILLLKADFVILDEPFSNLNPKNIRQILQLILRQKAQKGILISDHYYREIIEIADNLYVLSDGILREIKDFKTSSNAKHLYGK